MVAADIMSDSSWVNLLERIKAPWVNLFGAAATNDEETKAKRSVASMLLQSLNVLRKSQMVAVLRRSVAKLLRQALSRKYPSCQAATGRYAEAHI